MTGWLVLSILCAAGALIALIAQRHTRAKGFAIDGKTVRCLDCGWSWTGTKRTTPPELGAKALGHICRRRRRRKSAHR